MERISIRSLGDSEEPLRFSLKYDTVCPTNPQAKIEHEIVQVTATTSGTAATEATNAVNILQYILGWHR